MVQFDQRFEFLSANARNRRSAMRHGPYAGTPRGCAAALPPPDHGEETLELGTVSAAWSAIHRGGNRVLPWGPLVRLTAWVRSPPCRRCPGFGLQQFESGGELVRGLDFGRDSSVHDGPSMFHVVEDAPTAAHGVAKCLSPTHRSGLETTGDLAIIPFLQQSGIDRFQLIDVGTSRCTRTVGRNRTVKQVRSNSYRARLRETCRPLRSAKEWRQALAACLTEVCHLG